MGEIMSIECCENKGNKIDVDSCDGEIMVTIYSKEMMCELVVCMQKEESDKFKKLVAGL
jgi:hypothetical protein